MKRRDWSWLAEQHGDMPHPLWVAISLIGMLIALCGVIELATRGHR